MPGAYISFPFCAQKCSFCNFASGVFPEALQSDYIHALTAEIRDHQWVWTPDTVYIGGGTPSLLDPAVLVAILDAVPGRPWGEATIEAAPGTLTAKKVRSWRNAGINRVSLGVQSFVKQELMRTGRRHDAATVAADCTLLRCQGIDNINIDLIAGLPYQTIPSWRESLDWIERLAPPHVSVYLFEIDEDSRLGLEVLNNGPRYGASEVPSDDQAAELYEIAVERLGSIGIERYEISNFARSGMESHHNLKYWRLDPYAGFGADAHSFDGRRRFANVETAAEYVQRWRSGVPVQNESTEAVLDEERFFLGLRLLQGVRPSDSEWRRFEAPIRDSVASGLLASDGNILRLTPRGVLLSNEVFQGFITT
jgi:oxygen-independent coproporphyrinogen III oxidase